MAKRFTDTEKFKDPWFRRLSPKGKLIFLYCLDECNHAGILKNVDFELMSFQIGLDITKEDFSILNDRIIFIRDDVIFLPKFIKFQYGELNPNNKIHSSVIKELTRYNIDFQTLTKEFGTLTKGLDNSIDTLNTPFNKSIDTLKEKEKEKYKDKDNNISNNIKNNILDSEKTKFIKPTIEEIKIYCLERKNNVDAQRFYDYYEANGWHVGKQKMSDYKAAIRTWERNNYNAQKVERGYNEQPYNPCI